MNGTGKQIKWAGEIKAKIVPGLIQDAKAEIAECEQKIIDEQDPEYGDWTQDSDSVATVNCNKINGGGKMSQKFQLTKNNIMLVDGRDFYFSPGVLKDFKGVSAKKITGLISSITSSAAFQRGGMGALRQNTRTTLSLYLQALGFLKKQKEVKKNDLES